MVGMGAANVSVYRLLKARGVNPEQIVACDTKGTLHAHRSDLAELERDFPEKWQVCRESNPQMLTGGIDQALRGADVCIAFSRSEPGLINGDWIRSMARDAIVFACANPNPEIWPQIAKDAGARIVATGRGDFPNQVNNSLAFPGIFRGVLDAQATAISDEMALAAAAELAAIAEEHGLSENAIVPSMSDPEVVPRVAAATALKAYDLGLSRVALRRAEYVQAVSCRIQQSRKTCAAFVDERISTSELH